MQSVIKIPLISFVIIAVFTAGDIFRIGWKVEGTLVTGWMKSNQ